MTVAQLIVALQQFPANMEVVTHPAGMSKWYTPQVVKTITVKQLDGFTGLQEVPDGCEGKQCVKIV